MGTWYRKFKPELARLDAPGVLHHVIIRDIERRKIFRDNEDRNNLLDRLSWAARELGYGLTELARLLHMTQPGVGYAVRRGEVKNLPRRIIIN